MNKKHITLASAATLAVTVLGFAAPVASAATADQKTGTGTVQFYKPTLPTPPIDPTNPSNPSNPTVPLTPTNPSDPSLPSLPNGGTPENPGTGSTGDLRLDSVPNFNFGNHPVSDINGGAVVIYTGNGIDDKTGKPTVANPGTPYFVQVTDYRGTAAGWDVSVVASQFTTGKTSLTGATVNYTGGHALGVSNGGTANKNPHDKNPGTTAGIVTDGTTATDLFGATAGYGTNSSQDVFGAQAADTTLTIPATVKTVEAAKYTSTFTYTLIDTPTSLT